MLSTNHHSMLCVFLSKTTIGKLKTSAFTLFIRSDLANTRCALIRDNTVVARSDRKLPARTCKFFYIFKIKCSLDLVSLKWLYPPIYCRCLPSVMILCVS